MPRSKPRAAPAMMPAHPGQHRQPPLLAVVEALVERIGCIGDLLQAGRGFSHPVRAVAQTGHRIAGLVGGLVAGRVLGALLIPFGAPRVTFAGAGIGQGDTLLGEIAHRALDRRPHLFLIGGQFEFGLHGRDLRIDESRRSSVLMR